MKIIVQKDDGLILLAEACQFPALDEVLQEQWLDRMKAGKKYDELEQIARAHGARFVHEIRPTDEERKQFLDDLKRQYTPTEEPS